MELVPAGLRDDVYYATGTAAVLAENAFVGSSISCTEADGETLNDRLASPAIVARCAVNFKHVVCRRPEPLVVIRYWFMNTSP